MFANLAALVALTPIVTGAPVALAPTAPAPTNVQLSWVSAKEGKYAVTWDETGDLRNKVELVSVGGEPGRPRHQTRFVEAGQPNRLELSRLYVNYDYVIRVSAVDAQGAAVSEVAESAEFDTDTGVSAEMVSAEPRIDGSVKWTWKAGKYTDPNPGDPLDLPAENPVRYRPISSHPHVNEYFEFGPEIAGGGSYVGTGDDVRLPVNVGVWAAPNEWGYGRAEVLWISGNQLSASIPQRATIGGKLTVRGTATELWRHCDIGPCNTHDMPDDGREVKLQARAGAAGEWRTVATTTSNKEGGYTFETGFAGTRDYRVVALPRVVAHDSSDNGRGYAETKASTVTGVEGPVPTPTATPTAAPGDGGGQAGGDNGPALPITGSPVMWIAIVGGALVLIGAGLALAGRFRRRA